MISIIIPTYCRYDCLRNTIRDLKNQRLQSFEILVVDQTPETQRERIEADGVIYLEQNIPSASAARNLGLMRAQTPIALFLDDDVIIDDENFLQKHLRHYKDKSILGVAGAAPDPGQETELCRHRFFRESGVGWAYFSSNQGTQAWLRVGRSNNLSVRRTEAIACGGMDEQFEKGAHREEADFGLRMNSDSPRFIYDPQAKLVHIGNEQGGIRSWHEKSAPKAIHHMVGDLYCMFRNVPFKNRPEYLALSIRYFVFPHGARTPIPFCFKALGQYAKAWIEAHRKLKEGPKFIASK
ncbi:MAG: glycosyltransferase [Verrucomicrobiota bacterium]